jgi:hypothetical protein
MSAAANISYAIFRLLYFQVRASSGYCFFRLDHIQVRAFSGSSIIRLKLCQFKYFQVLQKNRLCLSQVIAFSGYCIFWLLHFLVRSFSGYAIFRFCQKTGLLHCPLCHFQSPPPMGTTMHASSTFLLRAATDKLNQEDGDKGNIFQVVCVRLHISTRWVCTAKALCVFAQKGIPIPSERISSGFGFRRGRRTPRTQWLACLINLRSWSAFKSNVKFRAHP